MRSFFTAIVFLIAGLFLAMNEFTYLIRYKALLWAHVDAISSYVGVLFCNVWALAFLIERSLTLRDTGRKLTHMDRQLSSSSSVGEQLRQRLEEQE